jgi:hypothetical protein
MLICKLEYSVINELFMICKNYNRIIFRTEISSVNYMTSEWNNLFKVNRNNLILFMFL